jgi:SET domain-containing protein
MRIHAWVGTSRIAGKGLFAAQHIKKGTRIIQYIGQRIAKAEPAERFHHCLSRRSEHTVTLKTEWR